MTKYAVLTETLCDGWTNTWTDDDQPTTFDTEAEAQAEIDDHIESMKESFEEALAGGILEPDEVFDEEGERAQMVIVEAGQGYIDPATATLVHLLRETA